MLLVTALLIAGCGAIQQDRTSVENAIAEVSARENRYPDYPQPNITYLSFSQAHGFQVNYLANQGKAWLWYPGNRRGVSEEYKRATISGQMVICWCHSLNSYNPVTRTSGGDFKCERLDFAQRAIVAALPGDPFELASGRVPHSLDRCSAPTEFRFDRKLASC